MSDQEATLTYMEVAAEVIINVQEQLAHHFGEAVAQVVTHKADNLLITIEHMQHMVQAEQAAISTVTEALLENLVVL